MLNRPFPGSNSVVEEELRCFGVYGRESVIVFVRVLEDGPDLTEERGYCRCRAPLITIMTTQWPIFCDFRMEDWGNKFKLHRLCTKTAVTSAACATDSGEFYLRSGRGSHKATPGSVKTHHLL